MPKTTFFNLNEEKKKKIEKALTNEFGRVSIDKVSISRIVEEAKIPRGSFYQYFENKEDAVNYIVEKYIKLEHEKIYQFLIETNGDIFAASIKTFDHMIEISINTDQMKLFKNILEEVRKNNINIFEYNYSLKNIDNMIDIKDLNINEEEDLEYILKILTAIIRTTSMEVITKKISKEQGKKDLMKQFNILKQGMLKI